MKLANSRQIFKKTQISKFHKNPFSGSGVVTRGQADRHDANRCFSQFCENAKKKGGVGFGQKL